MSQSWWQDVSYICLNICQETFIWRLYVSQVAKLLMRSYFHCNIHLIWPIMEWRSISLKLPWSCWWRAYTWCSSYFAQNLRRNHNQSMHAKLPSWPTKKRMPCFEVRNWSPTKNKSSDKRRREAIMWAGFWWPVTNSAFICSLFGGIYKAVIGIWWHFVTVKTCNKCPRTDITVSPPGSN